jgi:hypothetical protein
MSSRFPQPLHAWSFGLIVAVSVAANWIASAAWHKKRPCFPLQENRAAKRKPRHNGGAFNVWKTRDMGRSSRLTLRACTIIHNRVNTIRFTVSGLSDSR